MTSLLTTMRQRLAEAESDAERLRAAIQILEQAEASPASPRRARRSNQAAATTAAATATTRRRSAQRDSSPAAAATESAETAAAPTPTASAPAPRKRKPARKPAKSVVPLEKLLKVVGENPGLTTTAIAKETGGDQTVLLELLKESEQKGDVRRQGERRATSWYRITDEDRIAARAAEIAAQSKGRRSSPSRS